MGEVCRRIYWLRSKNNKQNLSCAQMSRSRFMVCSEGECEIKNRGEFTGVCILRELLNLWDRGGFDSKFRLTEQVVKEKLVRSYDRYQKLCKVRTLYENREKQEQLNKKKQDFVFEANCTFQVYKTDILNLIKNDENRDKDAKREDIEFLKKAFRGEMVKFDNSKDKSYHDRIKDGGKKNV